MKMNQTPNLPPEKMNHLLNLAGKKLGTNPGELKQQIEQGNLSGVLGKMEPDKAAQINQLLNNPKELEKLFNSPQMSDMIKKLMNK